MGSETKLGICDLRHLQIRSTIVNFDAQGLFVLVLQLIFEDLEKGAFYEVIQLVNTLENIYMAFDDNDLYKQKRKDEKSQDNEVLLFSWVST